MNKEKVLLIILDGFGLGKKYPGNAYHLAKKPFFEKLFRENPWVKLKASGHAVGLPAGNQGGSEVGHFTIGSGRVTFQTLEEINRSIADKSFLKKRALVKACEKVRKQNSGGDKSALHLIGMISDPGVHSCIKHLFALLKLAKRQKSFPVYIHAILDGRDVHERSAKEFIRMILKEIKKLKLDTPVFKNGPKKASIASIIGRYYAMDRDTNWNRTKKAYDLYTLGKGKHEKDPLKAVENAYKRGAETDYYVDPIILNKHGIILDKDSVINWNFRTDRQRQLTWAFTGETKIGFKPEKIVRPFFVCFGPYSEKAPVVFPAPVIKNNLGEILSKNKLQQLRIAETEKYAHVTFFFNSQIEKPFSKEDRILIHSPKCPSYAEKPEMSACGITARLISEITKGKYAVVICNFANCDLVGHSADMKASIKAVETLDDCLSKIIPIAEKYDYHTIIIGDHGNIEHKLYDNGEPCPSHTTNPVPFILISKKFKKLRKNGFELKDVAPTILRILNIKKPREMTGKTVVL